ncbi:MAG: hypothetical protein PHS19_04165 [Eubacteriales bacterium]|nr:hypothetical protein [Eubacteriales bacterium]
METFGQKLLKIYDRKMLSGEISFSQSGISRNDFTRLCIDPEFVVTREALEIICEKMKLTHEERTELLKYTEE